MTAQRLPVEDWKDMERQLEAQRGCEKESLANQTAE